jgi:putative transposase
MAIATGNWIPGWAHFSCASRSFAKARTFSAVPGAAATSEKALAAVIQEAWIGGVSTRRVEEIVQAMGLSGISRNQVSKLCEDIDEGVNVLPERPLEGDWPYLWLDATDLKQREGGRIVSVAAIIAVAVNTNGKREIIGLGIGPSEAETFWSGFVKGLVKRGLRGVKLVVSDAHDGLRQRSLAWSERRGKDAGCTGCATRSRRCPRVSTPWWPPRPDKPSCNLMPPAAHQTWRHVADQHQSARVPQQGGQAPVRRRRNLPK